MNVIGFCVYGNHPMYLQGMIENLKLVDTFYKNWVPYVYVSGSIEKDLAKKYHNYGAQVYQINAPETGSFMMYRYLPLSDKRVTRAIFRDADSRLNDRESKAVEQWIRDDTDLHIMRDHPNHGGPKILGGMWGAKADKLRNIDQIIAKYAQLNWYRNVDQHMLHCEVYPLLKDSVTVHDEFFDKISFPTKRNNSEFVGCQYDEHNNLLYPEHTEIFTKHL
jgi:hypothetical protein